MEYVCLRMCMRACVCVSNTILMELTPFINCVHSKISMDNFIECVCTVHAFMKSEFWIINQNDKCSTGITLKFT